MAFTIQRVHMNVKTSCVDCYRRLDATWKSLLARNENHHPSAARGRGPKKPVRKTKTRSRAATQIGNGNSGPGTSLVALLIQASTTQGLSIRELAENHLGLTYSHFALLRKGKRSISHISDETMAKIAKFLGLPKVMVMIAAGRLKVQDFYRDPSLLDQQLNPALDFIQRDPELGLALPPSAFDADTDLRRFIVLLYEKASGKTLLANRASITDVLQILQSSTSQG